MQSKTSFFSKTLFAHGLKRFWPLSAAVLLFVILNPGLGLLSAPALRASDDVKLGELAGGLVYDAAPVMVVCMALACILCAILVYNYLHKRSKIRFYHGLPISRLGSFATTYATGFVLIALPLVVGLLICMGIAAAMGAGAAAGAILALLGASIACLLLFFGLASAACILCGNTMGSILVYIAMNCFVVVMLAGGSILMGLLMPGVDTETLLMGPSRWLTPVYQLILATQSGLLADGGSSGFAMPGALAVYAVVGVVLLVLCAWLYRIRKDEMAGETVAFGPVGVICKVLFALVFSVVFAGIVLMIVPSGVSDSLAPTLVIYLIFAVIGWFVAEMLVRRSLHVFKKRALASCGVLVAAILVVTVLVGVDIFGVVNKVPEADDVKTATAPYYGAPVKVEAEDAIALHGVVLENREVLSPNSASIVDYADVTLSFDYELDNGAIIHRTYRIPDSEQPNVISESVYQMMDNPRYVHELFFGQEPGTVTEKSLGSVYVSLGGDLGPEGKITPSDDEGPTFSFGQKQAYGLYKAICADIEQGNIEGGEYFEGKESQGYIEFEWVVQDPTDQAYRSLTVTSSMSNTLAWIAENADKAL